VAGFIGSALVLLGVIGALTGAFAWRLARRQLGWEAVVGTVCASKVQFNWEFYEPRIEYTYSYRGRAFRGWKVRSLAILTNWHGPARRVIEKYPLGIAVTVYVDPKNPWDSVLERGGDPKFLPLITSISALLLILGWLVLIWH